jgi:hypothetical protein
MASMEAVPMQSVGVVESALSWCCSRSVHTLI